MFRLIVALVSSQLLSAPTPETDVNHASEASSMILGLAQGHPELVAHRFDARMKRVMDKQKLGEVWANLESTLGKFVRVEGTEVLRSAGFETISIACRMKSAGLDARFVFDETGRVSGLFFEPIEEPSGSAGWTPPPYANLDEIMEERWPLHGEPSQTAIVTRPRRRNGPMPVLVLPAVPAESEPKARTTARHTNKDLAVGLASLGVLVIGFDDASPQAGLEIERLLDAARQLDGLDHERVALAVRSSAELRASSALRAQLGAVVWLGDLEEESTKLIRESAKAGPVLMFDARPEPESFFEKTERLQVERYPALGPWLIKPNATHLYPEVVEDIASFLFRLPPPSR